MRVRGYELASFLFALALCAICSRGRAELTDLAYYRLGDDDVLAVPGARVSQTIDDVDGRNMVTLGGLTYSADTPPKIRSELSISFDGKANGYLFADAVDWSETFFSASRYNVGMEAWLKVDPSVQGLAKVPVGNGSAYSLRVGADGYFRADGCAQTPPSTTPVRFGQWQHVAFLSTGEHWQMYVDGEPQFSTLPEFCYLPTDGDATIGADLDGGAGFVGLIDEARTFTWSGEFNRADLLYFSLRAPGDVNEDGSVDQQDYNIWRSHVGSDLGALGLLEGRRLGDLNGDRAIDLIDFGLIKSNRSAGAIITVPEPASGTLLLVGWLGVTMFRRRHSSGSRRRGCES